MVPLSMTLSYLWHGFQGHDIYDVEHCKNGASKDIVTIAQEESIPNIWNSTKFGDLDWPLNASRGFISISWASCLIFIAVLYLILVISAVYVVWRRRVCMWHGAWVCMGGGCVYRPTPRQTDLRVGTVVVLDILSQPTNFGFKRASVRPIQWLKWFCEAWGGSSDEARLEQTPYTHSNPTNLALFSYCRGGGLKWEQGGWAPPRAPPLTLTTGRRPDV